MNRSAPSCVVCLEVLDTVLCKVRALVVHNRGIVARLLVLRTTPRRNVVHDAKPVGTLEFTLLSY